MDDPFQIFAIVMGVTLIPFVAVSVTAFIKIAVVLFLVRSALGVQQTPPNMVLYGVTLVLTAYVGAPVISEVYTAVTQQGVDFESSSGMIQAFEVGSQPVRDFLMRFTDPNERAFFLQAAEELHGETNAELSETDLFILAPAFVTAELTRAFEIGVLLYLPFVIIDLVVTNILTALGMMMVSPLVISLPFKLLLFVGVDGWVRLTHGLVLSYVPGAP